MLPSLWGGGDTRQRTFPVPVHLEISRHLAGCKMSPRAKTHLGVKNVGFFQFPGNITHKFQVEIRLRDRLSRRRYPTKDQGFFARTKTNQGED